MQHPRDSVHETPDSLAALATDSARTRWIRRYARIVLLASAVYLVFRLASAGASGLGPADFLWIALCLGLLALVVVDARPIVTALYIVAGLAIAETLALLGTGFFGASSLYLCTVPVLVALVCRGNAPYIAMAGGLGAFTLAGALHVRGHILPAVDHRLLDPTLFANWVSLAIAFACVVGPTVWLVTRVTSQLGGSMKALEGARSLHAAQVLLRVAAEQALERATARREQARQMETTGLVISGVVHDLRNSLSVLKLWSGSLRSDPTEGARVRDAARRIEGWCSQATEVTRDLMAVAQPPPDPAPVCHAGAQTEAAVAMLQRTLPEDVAASTERHMSFDPSVAFNPAALTSVILGLAATARLQPSSASELRLIVRPPSDNERESLSDCAAVVELLMETLSTLPDDPSLADEVADQGGRLLIEPADHGRACARLLLRSGREPAGEEALRANLG